MPLGGKGVYVGWIEERLSLDVYEADDDGHERSSLLWSGKGQGQQEKKVRLVKAALYAVQVFYSFFIM